MKTDVETISSETPAIQAAKRLHGEGIGSLVVVRDGNPVGIVTESDMVRLLAQERDATALTTGDCMSAPIVSLDRDATIEAAVELFREHRIKKLPVTDGGELVGIVTTTDLSHYLPHIAREASKSTGSEDHPRRRERPDTVYENDDWEFESHGRRPDHIDLGDVVKFSKTLSGDDVHAFAEASGDTNRLHLDEAYAAETRFGHTIAHGTLVVGTISAALARLPGLIIYLSQDVSYLGPVALGDRVTAVCEVIEDLGNDRYRLTTSVVDGEGSQVVDGEAVVIADPVPDVD